MANVKLNIKRLEFIIEDELTICNVFYESSEPDNPMWGGGWKTKTFPASTNAIEILSKHISDYIEWPTGSAGEPCIQFCRYCAGIDRDHRTVIFEYEKNYKCPVCIGSIVIGNALW